ncbi:MAG: pyridoxamine 5'-phosphate oxidase [bacterium]
MVNQSVIEAVEKKTLDESSVDPDPLKQFREWYGDAVRAGIFQPEVMHLSTSTPLGTPTGRFVLYKDPEKYGLAVEGFLFFTNFMSAKSRDIEKSPLVALTFYWKELLRQVRIVGIAEKSPEEVSDKYFESRPDPAKLGAWASAQSEVIESRAVLEERAAQYRERFEGGPIPRPAHWGGFTVRPAEMEFWQHREDRLHDRIRYNAQEDGGWTIQRLSP